MFCFKVLGNIEVEVLEGYELGMFDIIFLEEF